MSFQLVHCGVLFIDFIRVLEYISELSTAMKIIIQNKSKRENHSVIASLEQELKDAIPDLEIGHYETKSAGYGVTWWEVLLIWIALEVVAKEVAKDLLYAPIKKWAINRVKEMGENARPQYISILNPDGESVSAFLVNTDGTVEDKTDYANENPEKPPPNVVNE